MLPTVKIKIGGNSDSYFILSQIKRILIISAKFLKAKRKNLFFYRKFSHFLQLGNFLIRRFGVMSGCFVL